MLPRTSSALSNLTPDKGKSLDGEYTNIENEMNDRYKRMNPYGF